MKNWFLYSGQDHQEDCAEAAVPELQALLPAPDQGTVSFLLGNTYCYVFAHSLLISLSQRCKHFEIGGDKKGKGTSLF